MIDMQSLQLNYGYSHHVLLIGCACMCFGNEKDLSKNGLFVDITELITGIMYFEVEMHGQSAPLSQQPQLKIDSRTFKVHLRLLKDNKAAITAH